MSRLNYVTGLFLLVCFMIIIAAITYNLGADALKWSAIRERLRQRRIRRRAIRDERRRWRTFKKKSGENR
jgi:GH24 family phage-related lysozyme (muramidase)